MLNLEKRCRSFVKEHFVLIAMLAVLVVGAVVRWALFPFVSGDFKNFNVPWLNEMRRIGGNAMVADGRFNYSPLFFYLFKLTGDLFPAGDAAVLCKLMSLAAEVVVSLGCFLAVYRMQVKKTAFSALVIFSAFWLHPLLVLNASAWGQTDCYYVIFSLLCVWLFVKKQPVWAIAALGVACSWKLQGIFLLPLVILLYFCSEKHFSILWLLLIPAIMLLTSLPMGLMEMSPMQIFRAYFAQTGEHQTCLALNYPNIYALLGESAETYRLLAPVGVGLLALVFCLSAAWMIRRKTVLKGQSVILAGAWCVLMCTYLLPSMHDRYAMVGELLLLSYALVSRSKTGALATALCVLATLNAYTAYLATPLFPTGFAMLLLAGGLALVCWELYKVLKTC